MAQCKRLLPVLVLATVVLTPLIARAQAPDTACIRGAADRDRASCAQPPVLWRLGAAGPRLSMGPAELKLDIAAQRWGVVIALTL